ncbi:MAG: T9SS type A sorting domain-containing protein [Saprospiraceae bacterium]|nr:T9SS type A sorting domain-containing protein [Saprospiraceae bacterium]
MVFASGFLGGVNPGFEPWVALDNGGTFPLRPATNLNGGGNTNRSAVNASSSKAMVYPNPAADFLNISLENMEESEVLLSVVNTNGQTLMVSDMGIQSAGSQTLQLELNGIPTGTYFLRIQSGKDVQTTRFQVIR